MSLTYKQRLNDLAGRLEGLAEDAATAADEGDLDVRVAEAVQDAADAVERAVELL